jgi:hypothetical protein
MINPSFSHIFSMVHAGATHPKGAPGASCPAAWMPRWSSGNAADEVRTRLVGLAPAWPWRRLEAVGGRNRPYHNVNGDLIMVNNG